MRHHPIVFALSIALAGCATATVRHYSGVIERRESIGTAWYIVSPHTPSGYVAPWRIYVRLDSHFSSQRPRYIWIEFPDSATRPVSIGDRISFDAAETVATNDHVSSEGLREIVIVPKQ